MYGVSPPPTKMARVQQSSVLGSSTPMRGGLQFGGLQTGSRVGAGAALNPHEVIKCEVGAAVTFAQDRNGNTKAWNTLSAPSLQQLPALCKGSLRPYQLSATNRRGSRKAGAAAPFMGEGDNGSIFMAGADGEVRRVTSDAAHSLDYFQPMDEELGEPSNIQAVAFASAPTTYGDSPSAVAAMVSLDGTVHFKSDMGVAGAAVQISANDLTDYLKGLHDAQQQQLGGNGGDSEDGSGEEEAPAQQGGWLSFGWLRKKNEPKKKATKSKKKIDASPAPSAGGRSVSRSGLDESNMSSINGGAATPPYLQFCDGGALLFYAIDIHLFVIDVYAQQVKQYVDLSALGAGTQVLAISTTQTQADTHCYCLVGEVQAATLETMMEDATQQSNDSTLTVVQFSVTQGKLMGQPVNLSFKRNNAMHCGIHVLAGKIIVVSGNNMCTVNLGGQGMRHPVGDDVRPLQETVFGSRVVMSQNATPSLLLFNKHGFTLEALQTVTGGGSGGMATGTSAGKIAAQILAATQGSRPSERPDMVALSASEDILTSVEQNPTNWARSNLDVEDRNLMNFVTNSLTRRANNHQQLLQDIFSNPAALQLLKPQTQAALLSAQEKLAALLCCRTLQNEERATVQIELRQDVLKAAVVAVGNYVQQQKGGDSHGMTSAELCYASTDNLVMILYQVNESLNLTGSSPGPLEDKVNKALACGEIWSTVLSSIKGKQMAFRASPNAVPFMWETTASDFCSELRRIAYMLSDILAMIATTKPEEESADAQSGPAAAFQTTGSEQALRYQQSVSSLLGQLESVLEAFLTYHPERVNLAPEVLHRTLLRPPFVLNKGVGYPYAAPAPSTVALTGGASCQGILDAAERLALTFEVHEILFEFACSDVHDGLADLGGAFHEDPEPSNGGFTPQQLERLNMYLAKDASLYPFILNRLVNQHREREVEVLPSHITTIPNAVAARNQFISVNYPELHWLFEEFPIQSMLQDAKDAGGHHSNPVVYGDDAVEHCLNTLALASLSWVAAGRPPQAKHMLESSKLVAKAQDEQLPEIREKNLNEETIVAALLQKPEPRCWVEATKIAHHTADVHLRDRLLLSCLLHSAQSESQHFTSVLQDEAAGDNERKSKIDKSATAHVCLASAALLQKLRSRDKTLGKDMGQQGLGDVYALLTDWSVAHGVA